MFLLKRIHSLYRYLANAGISPTYEEDQRHKKLMNIFCVIWYHASVLFLISSRWFSPDLWFPTLQHAIISIVVFGLVHYLNARNHSEAAKLLFLGCSLIQCIIFSIVVKPGELVELFAMSVPMAAVVLYDRFATHLTVLLVSLAAALSSHFIFQDHDLPIMIAVAITLMFITSFLMVVYLKQLNQEKEKLLAIERNKAITDKNIIEQQAKELRALNDFKNHFFVNISHEIRTPLSLIVGYAQKLVKSTERPSAAQNAQVIVDQSDHIKRLVDGIIDLSRLDARKLSIHKTEVNISHLLQRIYSEFKGMFAERHIRFRLDIPEETVLVTCDQMLMTRAITNLVTNALKFTHPEGEACLSLRLNGEWMIDVYNTGIGIPEGELTKIFDRFYQVDNDITQSQGSGIGLALTKGIVETHGFRIQVASRLGEYALFSIGIPPDAVKTLREAPKPVTSVPPLARPRPVVSSSPSPPKKQILVVEDNVAMRTYITTIEGLSAYTLLEASHGEEALLLLEQQAIDLIITDYMMPRMNGLALVNRLKEMKYTQPVLVMTAQTDPQYKLSMLRAGIDGYLTKPFLDEELLFMVRRSLEYDDARQQFVAASSQEELLPNGELTDFNQHLSAVIDQNISNDQFTITGLCEQMHLTERTLFRRVKELCGCTPAKLITERRLLRAKEYHDQKAYKSTRQLALAVGFKNSTRFAKQFRTRFGVEP